MHLNTHISNMLGVKDHRYALEYPYQQHAYPVKMPRLYDLHTYKKTVLIMAACLSGEGLLLRIRKRTRS